MRRLQADKPETLGPAVRRHVNGNARFCSRSVAAVRGFRECGFKQRSQRCATCGLRFLLRARANKNRGQSGARALEPNLACLAEDLRFELNAPSANKIDANGAHDLHALVKDEIKASASVSGRLFEGLGPQRTRESRNQLPLAIRFDFDLPSLSVQHRQLGQ